MQRALVVAALFAAACAPQNAQLVEGDFTAYLSSTRAVTSIKGLLDLDKFEYRAQVDCREFEDAANRAENESLRLDDRLPICRGDDGVSSSDWPPTHEEWLDSDGFEVLGGVLDPWRGEAIITSEGDVQIAFHHRLPGADMRFLFVIDPDFQPRRCVLDASGDEVMRDIDGNWLDNWSRGADGQVFLLNGTSFQFPVDQTNATGQIQGLPWYIPTEWSAGFAAAKFGDDLLQLRPTRYALPSAYELFNESSGLQGGQAVGVDPRDLFFCNQASLFGFAPDPDQLQACLDGLRDEMQTVSTEIESELVNAGLFESGIEGLPPVRPRVHNNDWRPGDDAPSGLDGWGEMHYAWVRFDEGSVLEVGGSATGEFFLTFDANDNPTRLFVRGRFEVPRFKRDKFTAEYLPDLKFDEAGTELCGVPGSELY